MLIMHGIVTLLDNDHYQLVEDLWAELKREFSVQGVYVTPYPHFSYHVAHDYDVNKIESVLDLIASNITTFKVRTTGLGIFTGSSPVLYIPVVRSLELTQLQQKLWEQISTASSGIVEYYHPDQWMPHITIGFADITKENLSQIIPFLADRNFNWEITVNNIALIYDTGTKQVLKSRSDFTGQPSLEELHGHPIPADILEQLDRIGERVLQENNGLIFEDSSGKIWQQREERIRQLRGEDEE
jgi:2'-5' RNA ligase